MTTFDQNPEVHLQAKREHAKLSIAFWSLTVGASVIAAVLSAVVATFPSTTTNIKLRRDFGVGLLATSLVSIGIGGSLSGDKRRHAAAVEQSDQVLARNLGSHTNLATRALQTTQRTISELAQVATSSTPALARYFDLRQLQDQDAFPSIGFVAPMGSGKTRACRYVIGHLLYPGQVTETVAIDSYGSEDDYAEGTQVVTDEEGFASLIEQDFNEIKQRQARYRTKDRDFVPAVRIVEEAPATFKEVRNLSSQAAKDLDRWASKLTSLTRKVRYRLILVSCRLTARGLGLDREERDSCVMLFVGSEGVAEALNDKRVLGLGSKENAELCAALKAALAGVKRPVLVRAVGGEWYYSELPELDEQGNPTAAVRPQLAPASGEIFTPAPAQFAPKPLSSTENWVEPVFPRFTQTWIQEEDENRTWDASNLPRAPRVSDYLLLEEDFEDFVEAEDWAETVQRASADNPEAWDAMTGKALSIEPRSGKLSVPALRRECRSAQCFEDYEILACFQFLADQGQGSFDGSCFRKNR